MNNKYCKPIIKIDNKKIKRNGSNIKSINNKNGYLEFQLLWYI